MLEGAFQGTFKEKKKTTRKKGGRVLTSGEDGAVRLWDAHGRLQVEGNTAGTASETSTRARKTPVVWCISTVDWESNPPQVLSGGNDRIVKLWSMGSSARLLQELEGHSGAILSIVVDWRLRHALSGSTDTQIRMWDIDGALCLQTLWAHLGPVTCLSADWNDAVAMSGSTDGSLRLWDLSQATCVEVLEEEETPVSVIRVRWTDPGNKAELMGRPLREAVTGYGDGRLKFWNLDDLQCLDVMSGHEMPITEIAVNWKNYKMMSSSTDGDLKVWDLKDGIRLRTLTMEGATGVLSMSVDWDLEDGRGVAVVGRESGLVECWNIEANMTLRTWKAHRGSARCLMLETNDPELA